VERIAAFLRAAGAPARLEELPEGADRPPDPAVRAEGFACEGRRLVALVPAESAIDRDKLSAAAACADPQPAPLPEFPFRPARVLVDHSILSIGTVWLAAGSPRHVLGLDAGHLAQLTHALSADLVTEPETGEVEDRGQR
jgi:hypothetical protein